MRQGINCPLGWGVNKDGVASENPEEILFGGGLCPLGGAEETGGYKGYGLGLMVEMLCGVTSGSKCGPDVPQVGHMVCHSLIVIQSLLMVTLSSCWSPFL